MKVPEPLFKFINVVVHLLLRSPVHGFWSDSLLVIGFKGRKTGREYKTPVRYVVTESVIQCFTSRSGKWWRNVLAASEVTLLIKGVESRFVPTVVQDDPEKIAVALRHCLALFPQDAAYHDISMQADGNPNEQDFENALSEVVLIELAEQKSD